MHAAINDGELDALTRDFNLALDGRPVATVEEAAKLVVCHANTIRRAMGCGELVGSRRAANGPILIRCRELARWVLAGERRSLPADHKRRGKRANNRVNAPASGGQSGDATESCPS